MMTKEFTTFITEHCNDDATRLRMRFRGDSREWLPLAIAHIEAHKKGRRKLASLPEEWIFPSSTAVEQATPFMTAAYNIQVAATAAGKPLEDCRILDMTAGLGMDALGFARAGSKLTLLEMNALHADALNENFREYGNVKIVKGDSVQWLKEYVGESFDIIFIDPARRTDSGGRVYNLHDCAPDLIEIAPLILGKCRLCIAKLSPMLDITQTLRDLPLCHQLHVVEEGGECRELLAVMQSDCHDETPVVVVHKEGFTWSGKIGEPAMKTPFLKPEAGMFIMEPSPVVAKGMDPEHICGYGLSMLAPNSHLFVGEKITEPSLGRWSRVEEVMDFSGSRLKGIGKRIGAAEVIAKNLPGMTSDSLRKRLGIAESAERRVIGTSLADGRKIIILAGKRFQP